MADNGHERYTQGGIETVSAPIASAARRAVQRGRPTPECAERVPLALPELPDALVGRSVLHLSDLHVRRFRPGLRRLIEQLSRERPDLVFLTGDYMTRPGDEIVALRVMGELVEALSPRIEGAIFGVFGNHDYPLFREVAPKWIPGVKWMVDGANVIDELPGVTVVGVSTPGDLLEAMRAAQVLECERGCGSEGPNAEPYRIVLGHEPSILATCAEFSIEWSLAGHTHGGQMRIGPKIALHTSCDLPPRLGSGILRLRDSICTVSRGLGESYLDVRAFCAPQMPMYVLSRGDLDGAYCERMTSVRWW